MTLREIHKHRGGTGPEFCSEILEMFAVLRRSRCLRMFVEQVPHGC